MLDMREETLADIGGALQFRALFSLRTSVPMTQMKLTSRNREQIRLGPSQLGLNKYSATNVRQKNIQRRAGLDSNQLACILARSVNVKKEGETTP